MKGLHRLAAMTITTFSMALPAILVAAFDRGGARSSSIVAAWARAILWIAGVRVTVEGPAVPPEDGAALYVATHSSMLDVPALYSIVPARTRFVAKRELFLIPLFGQAIRMLGFVEIDRGDRRAARTAIGHAAELARRNRPILVFPEGTRSRDGRLLPFKKGAFALAHELRLPVVPIACLGGSACMPAHALAVIPGTMSLKVGRTLRPETDDYSSRATLMAAARAEIERLIATAD